LGLLPEGLVIKKMVLPSDLEIKQSIFEESFTSLKDPRRIIKGNIKYSLQEILFLTLSAVVSGCNTWCLIEEFGELKIDWLRKFHPFKHGVPSHDTLGAFFKKIC